MENKKTPTYIFALGGVEEIGKNMYVVEHEDEIFIIDCGIKFADGNSLLGVDSIICPFDYLVKNKNKVKGLIVTHAHEDHIGGIPYLLKSISIPKIYAAKLTAGIIKKKLKEHKDLQNFAFENIDDFKVLKTKHFLIEFFRVCHSIPDAFGIYFETPNGKIVSTGDFRFDFSTQGDESDITKMADLGRRGIDVLLCESTNAETQGFSTSERYIINEIKKIIDNAKGRVFVSTFASNLGRIEEIIEIAIKNNRKICLIGRSMVTNISTSIEVGFLNVSDDWFIETREINEYPDNEVLVLCTGSQGEEMAALNQMAMGKHAWITFKPTDLLIMSSNPIPGNYESVERLLNKLSRKNITIITNRAETKLHASGHATETEQQLMFKLINPLYLIPIHGEYKMLKALRKNAAAAGIKPDNVIQVVNGQKIELLDHVATATEEFIDIYDVYVDGNNVNSDSDGLLKCRKTLSQYGVFNITLLIDKKNKKIIENPVVSTRGCIYAKAHYGLMTKISYSIKSSIEEAMQKSSNPIENAEIRKICEVVASSFIWKHKRKKPLIRTTIFER